MMNTLRRPGLTLIEVLTVLAVIGFLVAILLPAVSSARKASRKLVCQNNLKQIGIGLASYHGVYDTFPPAQSAFGFSVFASLLPYLEQSPLHNSINFLKGPYLGLASVVPHPISINILVCPEDNPTTARGVLGWTNYAASRGSGLQKYGENGAFIGPPGATTSSHDFSDGLGNTVMVSEWVTGYNPSGQQAANRTVYQTGRMYPEPNQLDQFASECHGLNLFSAKDFTIRKGENLFHGELGLSLYNHVLTINDHSCLNGTGYQIGAWTAGSLHGGGANTLLGDGSCRFFSDSVELSVWRSLGSRNGGEQISWDN